MIHHNITYHNIEQYDITCLNVMYKFLLTYTIIHSYTSGNHRDTSRSPLGTEKPPSYPSSGSSSRSSITSLRMHESGGPGAEEEEEDDVGEGGSDDQKSEADSDEDNTSYRNTQFEIESEDEGERDRENKRDKDHDRGRDGRSSRSSEEGANRRHSDKVFSIPSSSPCLSSTSTTSTSSSSTITFSV